LAYTFDNPLRRLLHDPQTLLGPYVTEGMTVADIGCGIGHFSIGMAPLVGESGSVIAADLQQRMLDTVGRRARRAGVADRIRLHRCEPDRIGLDRPIDFALLCWVVHETPDQQKLFEELLSMLKPAGKCLIAEPKVHIPHRRFEETVQVAAAAGFNILDRPKVRLSHAALLGKG
jgi:ubiquinone/menaquinone biosynthesis C-methylase UbiE